MEWKYCVVEYEKESDILLSVFPPKAATKPCWNILYSAPFDPVDDSELILAFQACEAWIEKNKNQSSKYLVMEMAFYN